MPSLDVWFKEDIARVLAAITTARNGLTTDEYTLLAAICAGFDINLQWVLQPGLAIQRPSQFPECLGGVNERK